MKKLLLFAIFMLSCTIGHAQSMLHAAKANMPSRFRGQVVTINTEMQFREFLLYSDKIMVFFAARWCGPCIRLHPYYDYLAQQHPEILFLMIPEADDSEFNKITEPYGITNLPSFIGIKNHTQLVWGQYGSCLPDKLEIGVQVLK